jgi:predicted CDP-diglyceride synthetase/phosphatidate cytidylyltransferase
MYGPLLNLFVLTDFQQYLMRAETAPWLDLPKIQQYQYNIIGFLVGTLGVIGDMFESLVKRAGFAKDSGVFFPGLLLTIPSLPNRWLVADFDFCRAWRSIGSF